MYTRYPAYDIRLPNTAPAVNLVGQAARPSVMDRFGNVWVMLVTILLAQAVEAFLERNAGGGLMGKLTLVFIVLSVVMVVVPALVLRTRSFLYTLWVSLPFTLYTIVAVLSYFWSIAPGETMKWSLGVLGMNLVGVGIASLFSWRTIFIGIAWGILFLAAASVAIIPHDGLATDVHVGALRGLWLEKNGSSEAFAVGIVACSVVALADRKPIYYLGVIFLLACLVMAGSAGAFAACGLSVSFLFFAETIRRGPIRFFLGSYVALAMVGVVVVIVAGMGLQAASLLGRDTNLTGRTEIWPTVISYIQNREWLGYGFSAFWIDDSETKETVAEAAGFLAHNAHSSYFEMMLAFGFVGSFFMWFGIGRAMYQSVTALYGGQDARRYALPMLLMTLIMSLSESTLGGAAGPALFAVSVLVPKVALSHAMARGHYKP